MLVCTFLSMPTKVPGPNSAEENPLSKLPYMKFPKHVDRNLDCLWWLFQDIWQTEPVLIFHCGLEQVAFPQLLR